VTGGFANDGLDFFSQASSMFENTENLLEKEGFSFSNTVRTWLYLKDIHRDYDTLNLIRRNFFDSRKIYPYPASTGIQGISYPSDRLCQLDLYGISSDDRIELHPIYASTMIEAPVYGSYFSRGIRIDFPDKKVIYLSGTASIDPEGCVMHVGNISGQVERMLQNVKDLLKSQGATFDDLVSSVTYLKRSEYFEPFVKICGQCGFDRKIPNTICVADVCRPEWLCEIEAIAVLKK
jgi:enamine deaminase RidA (YjgF/YER057c/UK114 family)